MSPQQILTTLMTRIVIDKTIYHAKPHSICFLPQYQRNGTFVLTIEHTDSDLKVHALHYGNELLVRVRLFQKLLQTRLICRNNSKKNAWEKSNDASSLSIRLHTTKNHISVYFFTTISTSKKMVLFFFFRARAEKRIARHIDASSVVETLIYNGKLANQIASLPAVVVK